MNFVCLFDADSARWVAEVFILLAWAILLKVCCVAFTEDKRM